MSSVNSLDSYDIDNDGSRHLDDSGSFYSLDLDEDPTVLASRSSEDVDRLGQPNSYYRSLMNDDSSKSNLKMAFMNMANSIVGAGVIGQAYAVKQAGLVGGILLLTSLTVVIDWTIRLMVTNSKLSGMRTYQKTVKYCYGHSGSIIVSLAQAAFPLGGSMAYCVIIGDTFPHVIQAIFPSLKKPGWLHFLSSRNSIIVFCVICICYPLALNRNIAALAKASALALVSMVVITLTVAIRGPAVRPDDAHMSLPLWTFNVGFSQAVSVISFAFVCHHNTLLIYESLKTPTLKRFAIIVHWSTAVSMVSCMTLGLGGFLSFQDKTLGNILNNFPGSDVMANIARFCFGFNMITTLPLEIFVCREIFIEFFFPKVEKSTTLQHVIITSALMFSAMIVSLYTCDLGVILELVGASSACTMAYILPPLCYLRLSSKPKTHSLKILSVCCVAFGITVMILSIVMTLRNIGKGEHRACAN